MIHIVKIFIFLLILTAGACVSTQPNITATASDEDEDIGIGGTGMLASGNGLGGTGIVGEITGFGSIFVNGIEIEYDLNTAFTIDGKPAAYQQLVIGDVVEILTSNDSQHTDARVINLRHEVIGKVESINPETFSFTIQGQTIVQEFNKGILPEAGTSVAVSGFRISEKTIKATRVTAAGSRQPLLRTGLDLPFNNKVNRWLVQTHVHNEQVSVLLNATPHTLTVNTKAGESLKAAQQVEILKLHKSITGQINLDQVINSVEIPRGRRFDDNSFQRPAGKMMRNPMNSPQKMYRGGR